MRHCWLFLEVNSSNKVQLTCNLNLHELELAPSRGDFAITLLESGVEPTSLNCSAISGDM